jgi:hypothetical protein
MLAEKARRRSARHAAKAVAARQDAEALGVLPQQVVKDGDKLV